jgi:succinate dehydrogenase / fumarate reductase cytochrome b subunit
MKTNTIAFKSVFTTSVGRKLLMSLTGLFLCSFLIVHLSGNLLLLRADNGEAFMAYAEFMKHSPIIRIMELVLFAGFFGHIFYGLAITMKNNSARPVGYRVNKPAENSTFFSRFMSYSGVAMLIFLFLHLWQFFFYKYGLRQMPIEHNIYTITRDTFREPLYSIVYVVCMILLSFHLVHGFQSAFQTLGLQVNKKTGEVFKQVGFWFGVLIPAGFALIPLYFLVDFLR